MVSKDSFIPLLFHCLTSQNVLEKTQRFAEGECVNCEGNIKEILLRAQLARWC